MNKISRLKKYFSNNRFESLLFLYSLFLPLRNDISGVILFLLIFICLLEFKKTMSIIKQSIKNKFLILFVSLFLLHIVGLIHTTNFNYAFKDIDIKLPLLIFPFLIVGRKIEMKTIYFILNGFVIGCLIGSLGAFYNAIQLFLKTDNISEMLYEGMQFMMHSSYFALYLTFSIGYLFLRLDNKNLFSKKNILSFLLLFFFVLVVIFLNSRAGILGLVISFFFFMIYVIIEKKEKLFYFFISILLAISLFIFSSSVELFNRFKPINSEETFLAITSDSVSNINTMDLRMAIFTVGIKLFKENPIFGHGTGDINDVLINGYNKEGFIKGYNRKYNCHNQFLQFLLAFGLIGLLIFLVVLFLPTAYAFSVKNYLYIFFILILCFNFLFEAILETKAGVEFYAFFNVLLIGMNFKKMN